MGTLLLDTSVASLLHPKRRKGDLFLQYAELLQGHVLAVSFQTVAELWSWPLANQWGTRQIKAFPQFVAQFVVLGYDPALSEIWAVVYAYSQKIGRRLEAGDNWIMATAILWNLPLVTHDRDLLTVKIPGLVIISRLTE